ncbi:SEF2 [Candida jiufengensis]|uniref:SEF2 n=1 Tax=Candida jiufengensis TaxID=497108 RepID=UPI002225992E|nr:SEF2 [Candida jiufengensis]KAI5956498.1 SEF2 [Candida jiufengensis]
MSLQSKNRLRLIIPKLNSKSEKILKTCKRCRQHKTKCDAFITNPQPCSHCFKKNLNCCLEIINKPTGRVKSIDIVEKLSCEVQDLREQLDHLVERKNAQVELLIERGKQIQQQSKIEIQKKEVQIKEKTKVIRSITPPVSRIQSCLNTPYASPEEIPTELQLQLSIKPNDPSKFIISCNTKYQPIILSHKQAQQLFTNYEINLNKFLPIFPESFFQSINLQEFYKENELTFWSIILASLLNQHNQNSSNDYQTLCEHVKQLVVEKCWFQTPRNLYIISSLLILTTWPLPNNNSKISDNLSIKYISLMKTLSLQFGLHKLKFIDEFSHKTKLNLSQEVNLNNTIRERIYKFININSNYWLINLGLSNNNYNGFTQDYIINKSTNIDIYNNKNEEISSTDQYINSLLKISMIQSKLNENMNILIGDNLLDESIVLNDIQINTSKLINFNMFEIILNDLNKILIENQSEDYQSIEIKNLIKLSILYTNLQLFVYSMSKSNITVTEYKQYLNKLVSCCFEIVSKFEEFNEKENYLNLPIYYKFPMELTLLTLLRVFKSPLISTEESHEIKLNFNKLYTIILNNENWNFLNLKLYKIIEKFNKVPKNFIINQYDQGEFFLINKMKNYLVSSLVYEMIWLIFENEKQQKESVEKSESIFF